MCDKESASCNSALQAIHWPGLEVRRPAMWKFVNHG